MKKLATYLLLFLLPLAACKKEYKYPEDPKKTRKSPNERLGGAWFFSTYTLNDISIVDTLSKIHNWDITQYHLEYRQGVYVNEGKWVFELKGNSASYYSSLDAFSDFHYIVLRSFSDVFNKVFVTPFKSIPNTTTKWEVTKLYDKDLHLKLVTDTGEYKLTFIKQ